eukprot:scaffold3190_cov409-Prasinococcus_capsulatus_cf.AAC.4
MLRATLAPAASLTCPLSSVAKLESSGPSTTNTHLVPERRGQRCSSFKLFQVSSLTWLETVGLPTGLEHARPSASIGSARHKAQGFCTAEPYLIGAQLERTVLQQLQYWQSFWGPFDCTRRRLQVELVPPPASMALPPRPRRGYVQRAASSGTAAWRETESEARPPFSRRRGAGVSERGECRRFDLTRFERQVCAPKAHRQTRSIIWRAGSPNRGEPRSRRAPSRRGRRVDAPVDVALVIVATTWASVTAAPALPLWRPESPQKGPEWGPFGGRWPDTGQAVRLRSPGPDTGEPSCSWRCRSPCSHGTTVRPSVQRFAGAPPERSLGPAGAHFHALRGV